VIEEAIMPNSRIDSVPPPDWQVSQWFNSDGELRLADLLGQVVIVHAFQMLCPGCVSHALPQAERIHRQFADDGVKVIGLHTVFEHHAAMTPPALKAFLHEYRITHAIGVDQQVRGQEVPATMQAWGLRGTPSLLLFDRQGNLRLKEFGRIDDLTIGAMVGRLLEAPGHILRPDEAGQSAGCDQAGCLLSPD
jgi:thiol-disulfide isomerase/thioredoxin